MHTHIHTTRKTLEFSSTVFLALSLSLGTVGYNKKQICKGHKVVTSEASVTSTGIRKSVQPVKIE